MDSSPNVFMKRLRSASGMNTVWGAFLDLTGCGPLDGGCYLFAKACQAHFGGTICVVRGHNKHSSPSAGDHHFVLELPDGRLMDADGIYTRTGFPSHYLSAEHIVVSEIACLSPEEETASLQRTEACFSEESLKNITEMLGTIG